MKKNAFTLVEILIASALLSLVIISAFSVATSSTKSFESGQWRIMRQKEAQRFLLRFKETIEQANHAYFFKENGAAEPVGYPRDIAIASKYYNHIASASNLALLFASSTTPANAALPEFGISEKMGTWRGISMECYEKTLSFFLTGNEANLSPSRPASANSADVNRFKTGDTRKDFIIELKDIDSIGFFVEEASGTADLNQHQMLLTCSVIMVKPNSEGKVKIEEHITAKIPNRKKEEIVSDTSEHVVTQRRKLIFGKI